MNPIHRSPLRTAVLLAALGLTTALSAQAQPQQAAAATAQPQVQPTASGAHGAGMAHGKGHHKGARHGDPKQRAERHAQRLNELKTQLKLSPQQEAAWTAYTQAMQQPGPMKGMHGDREAMRAQHQAMANMTTPERLDAMQARHDARAAHMRQRHDATRAFYAALTPEQKKVFDTQTVRRHDARGKHRGAGGPGRHHQPVQPKASAPAK